MYRFHEDMPELVQALLHERFVAVQRPQIFDEILEKLTLKPQEDARSQPTAEGFEDLIGCQLGEGFWYNTRASVDQLATSISLLSGEAAMNTARLRESNVNDSVAKRLRARQVLKGQKILDLGCGAIPGFAIAAHALGADAYTVDGIEIASAFKEKVSEHATVDLTSPEAPVILRELTGGNCDLVSENIIGNVTGAPEFDIPSPLVIANIGHAVLRQGGYLDFGDGYVLQKISA